MAYGKPTGRIERCAWCRDHLDVDRQGRVPDHHGARAWQNSGPPDRPWIVTHRDDELCGGSEKISEQERERRAATRSTERSAIAIACRDEAAVMLDAFLAGRDEFAERIQELLGLALHLYQVKHPPRRGIRHPPHSLWNWTGRPGPRPGETSSRGDVCCTICGELLFANVHRPAAHRKFAVEVRQEPVAGAAHLTTCGLRYLAGLCEAVEPWTKLLPLEHRQETDA